MRDRAISAAILVPIVVVAFLLGQPWLTVGVAALALLAGAEAARLLAAATYRPAFWVVTLAPPLATLAVGLNWITAAPFAILFALVPVITAIVAFRRRDPREGLGTWIATTFGVLYVAMLAYVPGILVLAPPVPAGAPLATLFDAGRLWLLLLVGVVWTYDTAAFLVGRTFGRGRFMAHISPSKTWSGVGGGLVAAGIAGAWLGSGLGYPATQGMLLGLLIAVVAQAGDLAESMLKRAAGAKDSGSILPGHGGVLDRVDSFLFAAPVVYVLLAYAGWLGVA
jgi:phosphatidate cytidylyltransferase